MVGVVKNNIFETEVLEEFRALQLSKVSELRGPCCKNGHVEDVIRKKSDEISVKS